MGYDGWQPRRHALGTLRCFVALRVARVVAPVLGWQDFRVPGCRVLRSGLGCMV